MILSNLGWPGWTHYRNLRIDFRDIMRNSDGKFGTLGEDKESILRVSSLPSRQRLRTYRFTSDDSLVEKPSGTTNHSDCFCTLRPECTSIAQPNPREKHFRRIRSAVIVADKEVMSMFRRSSGKSIRTQSLKPVGNTHSLSLATRLQHDERKGSGRKHKEGKNHPTTANCHSAIPVPRPPYSK